MSVFLFTLLGSRGRTLSGAPPHSRVMCFHWLLNTSMWLLRHRQNATRLQLFQTSIHKYPRSFSGTHFSLLNLGLISFTHFLSDQLKTLCWGRSKQTLHSVSEAEVKGVYIPSFPPLFVLVADVLKWKADSCLQAVPIWKTLLWL